MSAAIIVIAVLCCRVSGDTQATLLVSQQILHHGTIRLDDLGADELARHGYAIGYHDGHAYDRFPLGTSLLSTPFVAVANLFGQDARTAANPLQAGIAASVIVAFAWLLFALARLFVAPWPAVVLTGLCVFGTSVASSGLATLFSHDFAILLATAAIFHVVHGVRSPAPIRAAVVATCLFLAYLCRPTLSLLAPFLLGYLFLYHRATAAKSAALLAVLLAAFMLWSEHEFSQWLPDYYLPQRLDGSAFATAATQYLIGPSRGLFVFSPFLLLAPLLALGVLAIRRDADHARILLVGLGWPLAHWLAISRFPHWWGGWSYGPRLMLDCLPGLFLTLFASLPLLASRWRRAAWATLVLGGAFSVQVNVFHAFGNPYSLRWSAEPNVDDYPEYLSDWRYPQFRYDAALHRQRMDEFRRALEFPADAPDAQFSGFAPLRDGTRTMLGATASLRLPLGPVGRPEGRFVLACDVVGSQMLRLRLNGHLIGQVRLSGGGLRIPLGFDRAWFVDGSNVLDFELAAPASGNGSIAFRGLSVFPAR